MRHHPGRGRGVQAARILAHHHHARQQRRRAEDGPRRRHLLKGGLVQAPAELRVHDVDHRRGFAHRDRLLPLGDLELRVDADRAPDRHHHLVAIQRREPRDPEGQLVGPRADGGESVLSARIGRGGHGAHHGRPGQDDGHAGQRRARYVDDPALELAEHLPGLCERRYGKRQRARECQKRGPAHWVSS